MSGTSSRAVRFDRYGDRSVLYVTDVPMPAPEAGEVVVRSRRRPSIRVRRPSDPERSQTDFRQPFPRARAATSLGSCPPSARASTDSLSATPCWGSPFAAPATPRTSSVPTSQLIHKPPELSWEVAGSLYVVGCTAYAAVRAVDAKEGETVAVSAAAGGVGTVVVQLLALRGSQVLGIASEANADWLRSHGAIPVPYGDGLAERLRAAAGDGIDAFIDLFGPEYLELAVDLGIPRDRIETIASFEKAQELGVKAEGSGDRLHPRGPHRDGRPRGLGRRRDSDRGDLSARPGGRRLRGVGTAPHPREDRPYPLILRREGAELRCSS